MREARLEQKRVHAQTVRKEETHKSYTASRLERKKEHARISKSPRGKGKNRGVGSAELHL